MTDEQLSEIEQRAATTSYEIRERVAAQAHTSWSGWMIYMLGRCVYNADGTMTIPKWAVDRWTRQARTSYGQLTEEEKQSDRKEADEYVSIMQGGWHPRVDVPALVAEVRRLRQFEAMAINNFGKLECASMAAHSAALTLFESMKAQLHPESEATPDQTTAGLIFQISNMVAGLRDERDKLRADVERIGHERDQMVAANVELQERLSRLGDDGK